MADRAVTLGGTRYPVILPSIRDPRLGIASVVLSVHALGQIGLHFWVSVPQILASILTCAVIEFAITFWRRRAFVWPASALLTGAGVALLLRVVGTPTDQPWATNDLPMFAGVAAFSLVQKYVIRYRGKNLLNPSNFGLVVAFLVFGNSRLEPLALWWAPLNAPMIAAYAIILVGGTYVIWRARMMTVSATFFAAFIVLQGVLAASGHCITANWAFAPVCGGDYWRMIITSPEVLIYVFFMVTDPPTVPVGRVARIIFALCVAASATILMAPQTDEFATKVALLGGLTFLLIVARPLADRLAPAPGSAEDTFRGFATRLVTGAGTGLLRPAANLGLVAVLVVAVSAGVVAAGGPGRTAVTPDTTEALKAAVYQVNPDTLPAVTVSQSVWDWDQAIAGNASQLMLVLSQNLAVESQALLHADPGLLTAVDHGDRLDQMRTRLRDDSARGTCVVDVYTFDTVKVRLIVPFGVQSGLSLGYDASGTITRQTYDSAGHLVSSQSSPFANTFALRRATGDRWLNVAVLPAGTGA